MLPRYIRLGLVLVIGMPSCVTAESECHQRAIAMLGCCPFCDESCIVSKDAGAQFAEDSCLADLQQKRADDQQAHSPESDEDEGETGADESGGSTFGEPW